MQDALNFSKVLPKRVLVIGGGTSGLVALQNLIEWGNFDDMQLLKRRDDVGGVWYNKRPISAAPCWPSPAYPGLIGNTHTYLRAFAAPFLVHNKIRLNAEVCAIEELRGWAGWHVLMQWVDNEKAEEFEETWDAVVVAILCYDHPVFPATPGITQLRKLGLAQHAQSWRGPHGFEGKRILVVGNANSGKDIAAQLAPVAGNDYVVRNLGKANVVNAHLTNGTVIRDLDSMLFGTGTWLTFAWTGAIAYPKTLDDLLKFEAERLTAVETGRKEMEAASPESTPGTGKTEASALVTYGVLGPFEEEYASGLHAEVVQVRPELGAVLPVWSPGWL
ncbi:hypothetical protein K438DRAFT_1789123 [Mycena galopus ATCC 62051]|nr:hypothetical protein K438DRAFT_1789123 [Mycena galopus ATCC 62051]